MRVVIWKKINDVSFGSIAQISSDIYFTDTVAYGLFQVFFSCGGTAVKHKRNGGNSPNGIQPFKVNFWSAFIVAMGSSDGDCQAVGASFPYKMSTSSGFVKESVFSSCLNALEPNASQLCLYRLLPNNVSGMYYFFCFSYILFKGADDLFSMTDVKPARMALIACSKSSPWSKFRATGTSGFLRL